MWKIFPTRVRTYWGAWGQGSGSSWKLCRVAQHGGGENVESVRFDWRCLRHFWWMTWWCLFSLLWPRKMVNICIFPVQTDGYPWYRYFVKWRLDKISKAFSEQLLYCRFYCSCSYLFDNFWLVWLFGSGSSLIFKMIGSDSIHIERPER